MDAVFLEDSLTWDKETKQTICTITVYNYTARARAYTLLAKWPEGEGVRFSENPRGGRKEATGLWAWRLDTLDPGQSAEIRFAVEGLDRGDWTEAEIFFRGQKEMIGATKIDEKLLEEMRKIEALAVAEAEHAKAAEVGSLERLAERTEPVEAPASTMSEDTEAAAEVAGPEAVAHEGTAPAAIQTTDTDWFGLKEGDSE
jgi:hypothetical protein